MVSVSGLCSSFNVLSRTLHFGNWIYFHPMMEKCVGNILSKTHYKELISAL